MACTTGMTKLTECLGLDLTNTLTRNIKFLTNLLKRTGTTVVKAEAQLDHVCLTGRQRA